MMIRIMLPDSHCAVRFVYPDSLTGLPRLRVGIVHNFGNGYFTCYHAGEGYKSYRFDRVRGALESFLISNVTMTVEKFENVTPNRRR